jgi:hypothetical protein
MSEQAVVVVKYDGLEIVYWEYENKWKFELRGRERSAESLKRAKEIIDKPDPKKKNSFKRIPALILGSALIGDNGDRFKKVEVTSVAEQKYYQSSPQLWIIDSAGKREQISSNKVYQDTPENILRMNEYIAGSKTIARLRDQQEIVLNSITTVEVPSE